jgi:hypothetical protein
MTDSNDQKKSWTAIIEHLVQVGAPPGTDAVDYFSSLVPRHLQSYGKMLGKEYDATSTKEQLREDWAQTTVVDVIDRIAGLDDESHRRGVRILVHFLDFGMRQIQDRTEARDHHRLRFDIYDLMGEVKGLKAGGDAAAYEQVLADLRTIEAAARSDA